MPTFSGYTGRFAPTPSGYLHFGSLMAALASYLDARAANGRWLLRMEDLDPPREVPGAQAAILSTLEAYGFEWDAALLRQSERTEAYRHTVQSLLMQGLAYPCDCSRKRLAPWPIYPGFCRDAQKPDRDAAIRLRVPKLEYAFEDRVQGRFSQQLARDVGDFVIRRRDGLFAYQLAVVLDDAWQGMTDVVRGADLLDSTPRQLYLQELLGLPHPRYLHVPLVIQPDGHKLGKSYRSPPLDAEQAPSLLLRALRALGQRPPRELHGAGRAELMAWGIEHWDASRIPRVPTLAEAQLK
ncbi:tRNA glutamyl-Q(34) synthetase GluQRS [Stutzerimonas kirkiae]|uniref:Glutamyl-Q tRNA(Asp) synthetase n=1 Tax=Stutzerimonas kirkiae TaxID=2211392 RepID=A0A4Q9QXP8_9GAMM|nr:tRNA glutamyl-Q(34) synthetase GluQRS [Stutzerimonas kirkiae]TBU88507.1 tRNA glutamyl-Q(34) synthetase GluQRS [Stutzerimonas kirkiae]TBU99504.1 tRNA glutamyl-Q(34) synthetase GluQRS [Stutzerimonas kirkiae]